MPTTKNQHERLLKINERLNRWGRKPVPLADLLSLCAVSKRTLIDDISYLRELGAPVRHSRKLGGYYYDKAYDLAAPVTLTDKDLALLETAVATLTQFQHLAVFSDLRGTVDKIEKAVRFRVSRQREYQPHILFESVPYLKGSEYIEPLLRAIHQEQPVRFCYQKFDSDEVKEHTVCPYVLKEHRNRWYLIGWQIALGEIRTYGLDRIVTDSLQPSPAICRPPAFDADAYFRYSMGVAVYEDQEPEEVLLSFTAEQGRAFRAQPFFPFEPVDVLVDTEAECRIRLRLIINRELVYELARLGPAVKVLAPNSLVVRLQEYVRETLFQYIPYQDVRSMPVQNGL